jgi:hypothetical protein
MTTTRVRVRYLNIIRCICVCLALMEIHVETDHSILLPIPGSISPPRTTIIEREQQFETSRSLSDKRKFLKF